MFKLLWCYTRGVYIGRIDRGKLLKLFFKYWTLHRYLHSRWFLFCKKYDYINYFVTDLLIYNMLYLVSILFIITTLEVNCVYSTNLEIISLNLNLWYNKQIIKTRYYEHLYSYIRNSRGLILLINNNISLSTDLIFVQLISSVRKYISEYANYT